jgi:hypothetical protein
MRGATFGQWWHFPIFDRADPRPVIAKFVAVWSPMISPVIG